MTTDRGYVETGILGADPALAEIVRRLVEAYRPERVPASLPSTVLREGKVVRAA